MAETISVRSPLRVDFVGMTDYLPACRQFGGGIVNATINKYIYAHLMVRPDRRIIFHAPDMDDLTVTVDSADALDPHGELGLAQEIVSRFDLPGGIELTTYSEMPAGAGLGSSSTIATSIIAALDALTGYRMSSYDIAEMARDCETVALRTTYGWQDQYSPVTGGGMKYMKYWPDSTGRGIEINAIELDTCRLAALEKSMVVAYSGISRPAKSILDAVAEGVEAGDEAVVDALKGMSGLAEQIRVMLLQGEVDAIGPKLTEVWELHRRLHPDVTGDRLEELFDLAMSTGATGGRVCGAGGGGTMLFFAGPGREYAVRQALRDAGARIFDCTVDTHGLLRWEGRC
jgi:D-glycero-alpha-D-manno-heptose-7-phosphate kinase